MVLNFDVYGTDVVLEFFCNKKPAFYQGLLLFQGFSSGQFSIGDLYGIRTHERRHKKRWSSHLQLTIWCRREESNLRPTDYKSVALPAELQRHIKWWTLLGSNQRPFPCEGNTLPAELSIHKTSTQSSLIKSFQNGSILSK